MADEPGVWIRRLAAIERPSASEGERRAAEWVLSELRSAGIEARIEVERAHGTHLPFVLPSAVAFAAGFLRRRKKYDERFRVCFADKIELKSYWAETVQKRKMKRFSREKTSGRKRGGDGYWIIDGKQNTNRMEEAYRG